MLMVEVYHTHPVLKTFVELLNQTRVNRLERDHACKKIFLQLLLIFKFQQNAASMFRDYTTCRSFY